LPEPETARVEQPMISLVGVEDIHTPLCHSTFENAHGFRRPGQVERLACGLLGLSVSSYMTIAPVEPCQLSGMTLHDTQPDTVADPLSEQLPPQGHVP
jgi:hypothetical protein